MHVDHLSVDLPRRGRVLDQLSIECPPASVAAVVGRTGQGASILLRALAQQLPPGSQWRGRARHRGHDLLRELPDDLPGLVDLILSPDDLPAAGHDSLLLVDNITDNCTPDIRAGLLADLAGRADAGQTVLWATHDLDAVWQIADHVVELRDGRGLTSDLTDWSPATVPAPTLASLTRLLDLPPLRTTEQIRSVLAARRQVVPATPPRGTPTSGPVRVRRLDLAAAGLNGPDPAILPGQSVGIHGDNQAAAALTASLQGIVCPPTLPASWSPSRVARRWERRHRLVKGSILAAAGAHARLRPRDPLSEHSPGEVACLRAELAAPLEQAVWLDAPERGLDPVTRRHLAGRLRHGSPGLRFITSHDPEFLVRACRTILVVENSTVVAAGQPAAVLHRMGHESVVSRALGSRQYVRLTDIMEVVGAP